LQPPDKTNSWHQFYKKTTSNRVVFCSKSDVMNLKSIIMFSLLLFSPKAVAQFKLDIEGGVVFCTSYNKVRIPATGGTIVNLASQLNISPKVFYRIRAGYTIANRHNI